MNELFDLELDDRNDLDTVTGREEFEQRLRLSVTAAFETQIGSMEDRNVRKRLAVQARRVIDRYEDIERVAQLTVEYSEDAPNTVEVTLLYATGEDFSFEVSE